MEKMGDSMLIFGGSVAFLLYVLYDINSVRWNNKLLHYGFFWGTVLLAVTTIGVVLQNKKHIEHIEGSSIVLFGIAAIFFVLLIFTLFFAIPFQSTYKNESEKRLAYTEGVYALCRHPGVLWFVGFYLFLAWGLRSREMFIYGCVVSVWNIVYIVIQDCYIFPETFTNYGEYKRKTPFLIPTKNSIKISIATWNRKKS